MVINEILQYSNYKLDLFSEESIKYLENKIINKGSENNANYYVSCLIREKEIKLNPEEIVRQLYLYKIINEYKYPKSRIQVEYSVHFGREVKRADIVIMDKIQL